MIMLQKKMVRKYLNQNYSKLKRDLQRLQRDENGGEQQRQQLFTDPTFPPEASSLFFSGRNDHDIVWKRPRVSNNYYYMCACTEVHEWVQYVVRLYML